MGVVPPGHLIVDYAPSLSDKSLGRTQSHHTGVSPLYLCTCALRLIQCAVSQPASPSACCPLQPASSSQHAVLFSPLYPAVLLALQPAVLFSPLSSSDSCPRFRPRPLPPELSSSARAVLFRPSCPLARYPLQPGVLFSPASSSARCPLQPAVLFSPRPPPQPASSSVLVADRGG